MAEFEVKNMEIANMKQQEMLGNVISEIRSVLVKSRSKVAAEVNKELLATYWKLARLLQNMRLLYLRYPICQSLTGKLTWTHYCELRMVGT